MSEVKDTPLALMYDFSEFVYCYDMIRRITTITYPYTLIKMHVYPW